MLDELRRELPQADVLVVDDGSTDRTAEVAREHGAEVISFGANRGLPAGIAAGTGHAVEQGYEFCGRVDADGQHPVAELARLLERVRADTCDVAVGSRFASGDGYAAYRYEPSGARRFGTALLRRSMKVALRRPFLDATSGMYAANAKALPILARPYTSEAPEVQALLRLEEEGLRVDEVPVDMRAARERRVQAPRQEGGHGRAHDRRDAGRPRALEAEMSKRLVAVLGYSGRRHHGLHDLCAERLRHAEQLAGEGDTVLLSGWARRRNGTGEAELMRAAWNGPEVTLVSDSTARSTSENAAEVAETARRLGADEVVVVTSRWHAPRARTLVRAALPKVSVADLVAGRTEAGDARSEGDRVFGSASISPGPHPDRRQGLDRLPRSRDRSHSSISQASCVQERP